MADQLVLPLSVIASVAASATMWWWLKAPLRQLLNQLCDRPGCTEFWARYTLIMLLIAPLAVVIFFVPDTVQQTTTALRRVMLSILLGHFVAFALVGHSLFKAVRQALEREQHDGASAGQG